MRSLALVVLLLAGCPKPLPPVSDPQLAIPLTVDGAGPCPPGTAPGTEDVCAGLFTSEGFACVRCAGAIGCVDVSSMVYCAAGPCLDDARCSGPSASTRRRR